METNQQTQFSFIALHFQTSKTIHIGDIANSITSSYEFLWVICLDEKWFYVFHTNSNSIVLYVWMRKCVPEKKDKIKPLR